MGKLFVLGIREFLDSCSLKYNFKGNCFYLLDFSLLIVPVPINGDCYANDGDKVNEVSHASEIGEPDTTNSINQEDESNQTEYNGEIRKIRIYEDLWYTKGDIIRNRLKALLGRGEVIFARKCRVAKIDVHMAREFLDSNHILGYSRSKYFYGLFYSEQLVAVAAFSASRPMKRQNGEVNSFEWVRYASVGCTRIIGGMGRLLGIFLEQEKPQEVMSYADLDWGRGNVYKKLGFELVGKTPAVKFMVNPKTYERYSLKKLLKDRKYKNNSKYSNQELSEKQFVLFLNSGNFKFLRSFPFL